MLPALGSTYTHLLLDQLEDAQVAALDVEQALRRCQVVFGTLRDSGEDSRDELWSLLTRFVALPTSECVLLASCCVQSHVDAPDQASISSFVAAFANRLAESEDADFLNQRSILIETVPKRQADLDESCEVALASLVTQWSQDGNAAELATALFSPVYGQFDVWHFSIPESPKKVTKSWQF